MIDVFRITTLELLAYDMTDETLVVPIIRSLKFRLANDIEELSTNAATHEILDEPLIVPDDVTLVSV